MFNWNRKNPQGNSLDKFIDIYEVAQCRYKAFDIRREVICADGYEYSFDYKLLDTKPGIYILYSIKTNSNKNRVVHTYIGKADLRSNKRGILQRLEEHVKNDADKRQYHDKWDFALCVTSDGTGEELFTPDVTKALEQWFIQLFKRLENNKDRINLINYNQKQESDGGSTQKDLDTHFNAIVELLAHVGILGVLSDGELGVNALAAKLETNKITVENIEKSIEKHKDQDNLREYSQEFIEDAVTSKIVSNAFYDSAKRFKDCTVYKDSNRIYQTFELQNYLKSQTVLTPENIAKDMVDTLPENVFSGDKTFLLLYQKDFVFGKAILDRYLSLSVSGENEAEKVKNLANFVRNRLFIATPSDSCYMESYKNFYNYYINKMTELDIAWQGDYTNLTLPNITLIDNYDNIVKNRMFSILEDKLKQAFRNIKHNSSGGNKEVKFDIVIGNPPYNNDLYIPFVEAGHKLSKEYTVMITPAKWQAKGGGKTTSSAKKQCHT